MHTNNSNSHLGYWYKAKEKDVHDTIFALMEFYNNVQGYREQNYLKYLSLYSNNDIAGLTPALYSKLANDFLRNKVGLGRITFNVCQNIPDAVVSKIAKNRPKPTFITSGGTYKLRKKAQKLDQYIQGQFYETKIYEIAPDVLLDACIYGTGILKIYRYKNRIKCERVFPNELKIDEQEGIHGNPRSIHQEKYIAKEVLIAQFPEYENRINSCKSYTDTFGYNSYSAPNDCIKVVESWHLPSGDDTKDGRHTITIETATLVDEEYTRDYFPFVFLKWAKKGIGFWGQGLVEQLIGHQIELNKTCLRLSKTIDNNANPKWFVEKTSNVNKNHLNNSWERTPIIDYTGQPPVLHTPPPVHPEIRSYIEMIYQKAYEQAGMSQSFAHSTKPAGLNSGKALREHNDIESERFVMLGKQWEQLFLDASKHYIDLAKEIAEEEVDEEDENGNKKSNKRGYKVMTKPPGKDFIEMIDWADVDMKDDMYMMQIMPTSMLSTTPSGRLSDVQELMQAGLIDMRQGYALLDLPDLKSASAINLSSYEIIERNLEHMVDTGEYIVPEKYDDLALIVELGMKYYNKFRLDGVESDRLELIARYIDEAEAMLNPPQPEQPINPAVAVPMGVGDPNDPLAVPEAPPVSNLLPIE